MSKRRKRGELSLNPGEWAPLKDAHAHIKTCVGSGVLAARRLLRDLISGEIEAAYCHLAPDGTETCGLLKPSSWKEWYVDGTADGATHAWGMPRDLSTKGGRSFFFVRRADLDKHYPREMLAPPTSPPVTTDVLRPPQRRRGPVLTHDWFSICGEIAARCIDPDTGRVRVPESENALADEMLNWLAKNGQKIPAPSEMREAVKRVCARLRAAQK